MGHLPFWTGQSVSRVVAAAGGRCPACCESGGRGLRAVGRSRRGPV